LWKDGRIRVVGRVKALLTALLVLLILILPAAASAT
jgi:hypothetical protein